MARVFIYDSKITAMSHPGGMVWKWAYQRRKRVEHLAKVKAPKRTGRLARSISGDYNKVPNGVVMHVTATADYSIFVHEGTGHWVGRPDIRSKRMLDRRGRSPAKMHLQPAWGGHPEMWRATVRGQEPQPFLEDALDTVMRDL